MEGTQVEESYLETYFTYQIVFPICSIDREEFTNGLLSVARVHGFDEVVEIPQIDSLWSQIDKDGNGLVVRYFYNNHEQSSNGKCCFLRIMQNFSMLLLSEILIWDEIPKFP
jgi:hypothetical protein